jgi:hypothetical protein
MIQAKKDTSRLLQMEMSPVAMQRLKFLKEKTEAVSYREVTTKALKWYEAAVNGNLCIKDSQGNIIEFMIL